MLEDIKVLKNELNSDIESISSMNELNDLRLKYLGKKSKIQEFSSRMKDLSIEEKKECGRLMNEFKSYAEEKISSLKEELGKRLLEEKLNNEKILKSLKKFSWTISTKYKLLL